MADVEKIEFAVIQDGDAVEWFTVAYCDVWSQSAIDEQRDLAIGYAKQHGGTVEEQTSYSMDRQQVWPDEFDEDD